ncbi:unnamed protein product [Trifolium pratense]|uniref:Uncharacterized protein n=1 Tax=Trifolium pratense TaxID=57577 RepID=A0ACB0KAI3_TRIPR|nr:unnamed protein product [Trifolium pratense]
MDNRDSKKVVADGSEFRRGKKRAEVPKPAPARSQKGKEAKVMFPSSDTSDTSSSDESADFIGAVEEFLRAHQSPHLYPPGPASGEGGSQVGKEAKIWPEEVLWTDSDSAISSDQQPSSSIRIRADVSWVADEPRETASVYQDCESDIPETMCTDIQTPPTEDFEAKGKLAKGPPVPSAKHGWVSLRQRKRLFDMFDESVRGFKSVFYGVRPITTKGWNNFVRRGHRIDELGQEVLDEQGLPIEEDFARFPFYWRRDHYSMSTKEFVFTLGALSAEERADYKKLLEFVEGLPPFLLSDSNGEPLLGEDGRRLTCPKVIATKELLACDTSEELTVFWSTMTSGSAALRKARVAKNKREASSAATTSSAPQSPTASNVDRSKRTRLEEETSSRQDHVIVDLSGQDDPPLPGPHKLTAGLPADDFVLPPLYAHGELLTGATKVKINPADEAILSDMGPEVLRAEIAAQSMALLKLVEMATFLNGRECKYLEERDEARKELPSLQRRLAESEASCEVFREERKTLSANLKEAEDRLKTVSEERDSAVQKVDEQKGLIGELEGKLERLQVTGIVEDREKELDPQGEYASSSRADLIAKIQELESNMVAAAAFSFNNAVAQLRILNPGLNEEGLDEEKEVRDGAIVTPPDDEV